MCEQNKDTVKNLRPNTKVISISERLEKKKLGERERIITKLIEYAGSLGW